MKKKHPKNLPTIKNLTFLIAGPLLCLLITLTSNLDPQHPEMTRMAGVAVWMALWWITEAIPLAATALLPVVLFPVLGIMDGHKVSTLYFNWIIFLFIGGFIIALAMEKCKLHKRIALEIIRKVGLSPGRLILGFMVACGFLSMWMSNTATTMMMVPIAMAIIVNLEEASGKTETVTNFSAGLLMGIAYSSSIGGIATLIGTPPNLSFVNKMLLYFPDAPPISFGGWMFFAFPLSMCMMWTSWLYLTKRFCPSCEKGEDASKALVADPEIFNSQYRELGKMSYEEKWVGVVFITTALLWMTRSDIRAGEFILHGWGGWLPMMDDGTVAMMMALLLFIIPTSKASESNERLINWKDTIRLPWGIVILFGGGFALASGMKDSGLSLWLGSQLSVVSSWHPVLLIATLNTFMTFLTEFTTNIASVEMILPILADTAVSIGQNPLLLMIPVTISASYAFMLPVATAPNAIAFGTDRLTIKQMATTGVWLNLMGVAITTIFTFLVGLAVFSIELNKLPPWVN